MDTEDGVTIDITCSDGGSKCSSSNTLKYTGQKKSTTYYVNDNAGNTGSCGIIVSNYQCHPYDCNCSSCYYGENTCRYGCDTCTKRDVSYEYSCNEDGVQCVSVPIVKNVSYDCRCSSCKTGHNTCRYGCDTCYKTCYK